MIVNCPTCGSAATLPEGFAGRRFACPQCGAVLPDPAAILPAPAVNEDPLSALAAANAAGAPPPSPGQYGPPAYRAYRAVDAAPGAVAALVCGILAWVTSCAGIVLAIVAITQANKAREYLRRYPGQYTGEGLATAGRILAIIALVVDVLSIFGACVWFAGMGAWSS